MNSDFSIEDEEQIRFLSKNLNVKIEDIIERCKNNSILTVANSLGCDCSDYDNQLLAGRLLIFDLRKRSPKNISQYCEIVKNLFNENHYNFILNNSEKLDSLVQKYQHLDYEENYFSASTYIDMYSIKEKESIEPPSLIYLRITVQICFFKDRDMNWDFFEKIYSSYMNGYYTPASPVFFNSCLKKNQISSCFLLKIDDNIESIFGDGVFSSAIVSANKGGVGLSISNIRGENCSIGSKGKSQGIINMLKVFDRTISYVKQGSARGGAATIFLRIHHIDVLSFIESRRKSVNNRQELEYVNICIWNCNLFMQRASEDGDWTLFCPKETEELNGKYGAEFDEIYKRLEKDERIKHKKVIKAKDILIEIVKCQNDCGEPYMMNGDACNYKSNHKHLDTIDGSNLCLEILQRSTSENISSCNLHSLNLRSYYRARSGEITDRIDFDLLGKKTREAIICLNNMIDTNYYPFDNESIEGKKFPNVKGKISHFNFQDRPIALGCSGLYDLFCLCDISFQSERASIANKMIFASMYFNALSESVQLAITDGVYETFKGSPTSQGKLQFHLWKEEYEILKSNYSNIRCENEQELEPSVWMQEEIILYSKDHEILDVIKPNWDDLVRCIMKYGLRNSLVLGLMPTATVSQIRRNNESFEPTQSNLYVRKTKSGSFKILNPYLCSDFKEIGVWNEMTLDFLEQNDGSLFDRDGNYLFQNFVNIKKDLYPNFNGNNLRLRQLCDKYKTIWELKNKITIDLSASRALYVDQSQSFNLYMENPDFDKYIKTFTYLWNKRVKTMVYYMRQRGNRDKNLTTSIKSREIFDNVCHACT